MKEQALLNKVKQGDRGAFSLLFETYYKDLVLFGGLFLSDRERCEDIVQSVFLKLWSERASLQIDISLKSYLLRIVKNSCLDDIRHQQVVREHESRVLSSSLLNDVDTEEYILYSDLNDHLQRALKQLPDTYREVFEMNRFEGLKYKEIAERLDVSERTVEVRISKALTTLRVLLKEFLK